MKKNIKLSIVSVLSLACLATVGAGAAMNTKKVSANTDPAFEVTSVSIRPESEAGANDFGIRFQAKISKSQYNANKTAAGEGRVIYGMEIKADGAEAVDVVAGTEYDGLLVTFAEGAEEGYFVGSLVDIQNENKTRPYSARAYYKIGEGEKVYTEWSEARAIFSVATQALADENPVVPLSEETEAKLTAIVNDVTNSANAGYYVADNFYLTAVDGDDATTKDVNALEAGDVVTVNATAKNSVNDARTLDVYPTISLTSPTGATMKGNVFEQVAGTQNQYEVKFTYPSQYKIAMNVGSISETADGEVSLVNGSKGYKATVEGNQVTIDTGSYYKQGEANNPNANGNGTDLGFYGLGELAADKKLVLTFTGKSIPNVTLFADSENGQAIGGGQGIYIQTSSRNSDWNGRMAVLGANSKRYESGVAGDYASYMVADVGGKNGKLGEDTAATAISMGKLTDGVKYEYTIMPTLEGNTLTKLEVALKSWNDTDGAYTTVVHSKVFSLSLDVGANRKVIAYGATSVAGNPTSITFNYEMKDLVEWTMISTADDVKTKLLTATSGYYKLANNITWETTEADLSAATNTAFTGVFDGNGHKISNFTTKGLFNILKGATIQNLVIDNAVQVTAQNGILADRIDDNTKLSNVVIRTNRANSELGGVLCRYLHATNLELNDVIIITASSRGTAKTDYGFISGFADKTNKVLATNCYFVTSGGVCASGVRTGAYYNDVWSETDTNAHLATSATDTKYGNFFKTGSSYEIFTTTVTNNVDAVSAFTTHIQSNPLSATLAALYAKLS